MKTTKLVSAAISAIIFSASVSVGAVEIESFSDELTVYLNGENVYADSENKPFIMNERTMVPLRPIFEAMGISDDNITYMPDPEVAQATFSDGRTSCTFYDDSTSVTRSDSNGEIKTLELDVPATIYNGNFYIPLRAFCNLWDMGIEWDDATRSVFVTGNIIVENISAQQDSGIVSSTTTADSGDKLISDLTGKWDRTEYSDHYSFCITNQTGNRISFWISAIGGDLNEGKFIRIGETETITADIVNNVARFDFTDSYGNTGKGKFVFNGDTIELSYTDVNYSGIWCIDAGAGTYKKAKELSEINLER